MFNFLKPFIFQSQIGETDISTEGEKPEKAKKSEGYGAPPPTPLSYDTLHTSSKKKMEKKKVLLYDERM